MSVCGEWVEMSASPNVNNFNSTFQQMYICVVLCFRMEQWTLFFFFLQTDKYDQKKDELLLQLSTDHSQYHI